jgi:hypothetical protein
MAMAGLLTAGFSTAATAKTPSGSKKPAKTKPAKPVTTKVSCKLALVVQPPADDVTITPGDTGAQFGKAGCGKPLFRGLETATFSTDDSGDLVAPYTLWFKGGTLSGQWTLSPTGATPPTNSFTAQSYTGTATITGGSGAWAKATGKATIKASTTDGVHFTGTESLQLTTPPPAKAGSSKRG